MSAAAWLQATPGSEKWRALFFARGPRAAICVLALALGVQAAMIVTDLVSVERAPSHRVITSASRERSTAIDVAAITNTHLFGMAPTTAGAGANAPRTTMSLVLTGVIAANDPRVGLAILGPSVEATKVYAVGDSIPGGARLHAVFTDHVLLERDGHLETLALPRQLASSVAPLSLSTVPTAALPMSRLRQLISQNPGLIGDIVRPEPVFAGGRQQGFRIYPGRDPQAFLLLGLRPGDLVTAIDGAPLRNPSQGEEILLTLGASSDAQVTILRDGQQQILTLDLTTIEQEAESLSESQYGASGAPPPPPQRPMPLTPR